MNEVKNLIWIRIMKQREKFYAVRLSPEVKSPFLRFFDYLVARLVLLYIVNIIIYPLSFPLPEPGTT